MMTEIHSIIWYRVNDWERNTLLFAICQQWMSWDEVKGDYHVKVLDNTGYLICSFASHIYDSYNYFLRCDGEHSEFIKFKDFVSSIIKVFQ